MKPCRSDCPSGDCANCVGFHAKPAQADRCEPSKCAQRMDCMRARLPARIVYGERIVIDASTSLKALGFCPMFIDTRARGLLEAA